MAYGPHEAGAQTRRVPDRTAENGRRIAQALERQEIGTQAEVTLRLARQRPPRGREIVKLMRKSTSSSVCFLCPKDVDPLSSAEPVVEKVGEGADAEANA